ncbi:MAG: hypothetical protein Q9183_004735, partial [Haloplaca sp. 2 TL-2023]
MDFLTDFKNPPALANWEDPIPPTDYGPIQYPAKDVSEDCLTLDVIVPRTVWDTIDNRSPFQVKRTAPVSDLVLTCQTALPSSHGLMAEGNYVLYLEVEREYQLIEPCRFVHGSKDQFGSPEGLFDAAVSSDGSEEENVICVAMNYRLGAFGWFGGSKYQSEGGSAIIGLLDQALAMEWVRRNID